MASFTVLFFSANLWTKQETRQTKHPTLDIDLLDKGFRDNDLDL